jgi:tRNA A-37 threonylcarbamoyl transferase component Bud32
MAEQHWTTAPATARARQAASERARRLADADALSIFRPGDFCAGDRYPIIKLISCGGFAEVYEAWDVEADALRAIKVLQARHQGNEAAIERLVREARVGIDLVHTNLVRTYDAGNDANTGVLYVVMERLEGQTLRDLIRFHGQIPALAALDWAAEVADAVHLLNELGIVHRDLKPENIFITLEGVAKVLDLGNMRIDRVGLKTTQGAITGTALYMSPEHLSGEKVDRRADVYALSQIAYECLAGKHPLLVGCDHTPSTVEIAGWQLLKEAKPLTDLVPELPSRLWQALERGLAKKRDERLPTAAELAVQLRAVGYALTKLQHAEGRVRGLKEKLVQSTTRREPMSARPADVALAPAPRRPPIAVTPQGTEVMVDTALAAQAERTRPMPEAHRAVERPLPLASASAAAEALPEEQPEPADGAPQPKRDRWILWAGLVLGLVLAVAVIAIMSALQRAPSPTLPEPGTPTTPRTE